MEEYNRVKLRVSILEGLILQLEMEEKLYINTRNILIKEAQEINKKYKTAMQIEGFLQEISQYESDEEIKKKYIEFSDLRINKDLKMGDIFKLMLDDSSEGRISYAIRVNKGRSDDFLPSVGKAKIFQLNNAIEKNNEKVIVNAMQIFEDFFAKLLKSCILSKPKNYLYDKTITFDKLLMSDLNELKKEVLDHEVEALMYNVLETIELLNKKEKFNLEKYKDLWDDFIEVYAHRNIIVHNQGIINDAYLKLVPEKYKNQPKGKYINITSTLLKNKINTIIKFSYLLFYLNGTTEQEADILEDTAFQFLKKEMWSEAKFAYELLIKLQNISNAEKLNYKINIINAVKHLSSLEEAKKEINNLDVTGLDVRYKIAKELLLENNINITQLLEENYPYIYNSDMIQTWPIFIEYRKTDEYKEFREKHKEDFEIYEYLPETLPEN